MLLTVKKNGKHIFIPTHFPSQPLSMKIIPAECRYLGLFVMVEVYHSLRLCWAASHELMMNARRYRMREIEQREMQGDNREMGRKEKLELEISQRCLKRLISRGEMRKRIGERRIQRKRENKEECEIATPLCRLATWFYHPWLFCGGIIRSSFDYKCLIEKHGFS